MPREPDSLPDWFLGGAGKRRLLRALVDERRRGLPWTEPQPWSRSVLARAADLHQKNAVRRHLDVLVLAELLVVAGGGYRLNTASPLIGPLRALLEAVDALPEEALPPSRGGTAAV